jgi:hypothetical protein
MARENQGLQISLIIFVMLAVVLGVSFFLYFRKYDEALGQAKMAEAGRQSAEQKTADVEKERDGLRRLIGYPAKGLTEMTEQYDADKAPLVQANYPEQSLYYSPMVRYLLNANAELGASLGKNQEEVKILKEKLEVRQKAADNQISGFVAARDTAVTHAKKVDEDSATEITRRNGAEDASLKALQDAQKAADIQRTALTAEVKKYQEEWQKTLAINKGNIDKLRRREKTTIADAPNGEVTAVSQHTGTVWINIGSDQALERQITFTVYPSDSTNLSKATKKATIEVISVEGARISRARILDDKIADPIMVGDKIFSPVWSPEPRHFALAGFIDLDGDGKSDLQTALSLIRMNGGVVDAYMDDKGHMVGQMSMDTRYLVMGQEPKLRGGEHAVAGKNGQDGTFDTFTEMQKSAETLGVTKISLIELKERMGYKPQAGAQRIGKPSSAGGVGDKFQPRTPPATSKKP